MVMPGVSNGTTIIDCWACLGPLKSVLPMKIAILQRGSPAPELHHLVPLITYSSPSRWIDDWMLVASDDATAGSVIAKQERILPSSSGCRYFFLISSLP